MKTLLLMAALAFVQTGESASTLISISQSGDPPGDVVIGALRLPEGANTDTRWDRHTAPMAAGQVVKAGRAARAMLPGDLTGTRIAFRFGGMSCTLTFESSGPALHGCDNRAVVAVEEGADGRASRLVTVNLPARKR